MEAIGIIFLACLAFAIAILLLITCCFFKVNGGKNSRDLEMCKADRMHQMHQTRYNNPTNNDKVSRPNPNVILFLNKKSKYSDESRISNQNLTTHLNHNQHQRIDDVDGIFDKGYPNENAQNDSDPGNDKCVDGSCQTTHSNVNSNTNTSHGYGHQSNGNDHGTESHSYGSNHGFGEHNSSGGNGVGHFNEGFSSHFSSHHGDYGHHSSDGGHHGGYDGGDGDGGSGDD